MKSKHIVALLLFLVFVQGLYIAVTKSRTIDEVTFHLNSGYRYLTTGIWDIGINNPPLTATLAALPLLFVKDKSKFIDFDKGTQIDYINSKPGLFPKNLLIIARLIPLLFMVLLGYFVFLWARDLYGMKAGLFALFLYSFSPNMLAFGSLVTADIGGALFIFLSMYTFWKYISNPTKKNLVIAGIGFGLAQITKMLSVFLIPAFILYCLMIYFFRDFNANFLFNFQNKNTKKISDIVLSLFIVFVIGLLIINTAYLFKGTFTPLSKYSKQEFMSSAFRNLYENNLVNWVPIPLPKQYVLGHDQAQWQAKDEVRGFFFWGKIAERFRSYYILHLLIKTPIAIFVLIFLGFLYFRKLTIPEIFMISYIFLILFMLTFFSKLAIGYRHVLSAYPLLCLFSARILKEGIPKNKIVTALIAASALWYLASSLLVFPHHLAYFNEFTGVKNGYKYTIDSNLDWEQDLDSVKKYVQKNKDVLVDPGCQPVTGRILVPANSLQFQKWVCYQWLKQNFEPVDYIGYSWLVYDVKGKWQQTDKGFVFVKE
ncbi:glycosyltransferase family 39 protein [Candidatus Woesearchaeota archaeon]|nr:glycosyltransferase family 39 protein [Candidatus Woesearchaeota archaeon]